MTQINWMKYRRIYLAVSLVVIGAGIISLLKWGLRLGVDFTGGALVEYRYAQTARLKETETIIKEVGITLNLIQPVDDQTYLFKLSPVSQDQKNRLSELIQNKFGSAVEELKYENVGPSIGPELVRKTIYAVCLSAAVILFWIAYQFKSIKFGVSAVVGMFHDTLVVVGVYSIFGHYFGAEVDFLFVTAMLTILSFSVHDTIVNYDRIRELLKKYKSNMTDLANLATTQTMVRSLNNSFTIIFMLVALILLGGTSIKWFAVTLLVGTISGTYSSPFVSVALLVTWDELEKRKLRLTKNS